MILVFSFLTVVMILSAAIFAKTTHFLQVESRSAIADQAINLAEAGIDYAMWALNDPDQTWCGEADPLPFGGGSVKIEFDCVGTNVITSTAYIPDISAPRVKRAIQIQAQISPGGNAVFDYATYADSTDADAVNFPTYYGGNGQIWGNVISNGGITKSGETPKICGDAWAKGSITLLAANFYEPNPPPCSGTNPYPEGRHPNYTPWQSDIWKLPDFPFANIRGDTSMNEFICTVGVGGECTINASDYFAECSPPISQWGCLNNRRFTGQYGNFRFCGNFYIKDKIHIKAGGSGFQQLLSGNLYKFSTCAAQFRPFANTNITFFLVDGIAKFNSVSFQKNGQGFIWLATDKVDPSPTEKAIEITSNPGGMKGAVFQANLGTVSIGGNTEAASVYAKKISVDNAILKYDSGLATQGCPGGDCSAPASWTIKRGTYQYIDPN